MSDQSTELRICRDCKHFQDHSEPNYRMCVRRAKEEIDLVSGERYLTGQLGCYFERDDKCHSGFAKCGTNGHFFEPKEKGEL